MDHSLKLIRMNDRELLLRYRAGGGLVFLLLGIPLLCVGALGHFHGSILARCWFLGIAAVLTGSGLRAAVWRDRLSLDLASRTYTRARGFLWKVDFRTGALNEIDSSILSTEVQGGGRGGRYTVWIAGLRFRGASIVQLEAERNEAVARNLAQKLTQALRIPLIDQTVEPPVECAWREVGVPLVARGSKELAATFSTPGELPPPPGRGISLTRVEGSTTITLPVPGIRVEALLLMAFMSVFGFIGCRTVVSMVQAVRSGAEHYWLGWVIGGLFAAIGIGGWFDGVRMMWAQEWLQDKNGALALGSRLLGISFKQVRIDKGTILDIAVRPAESVARNRVPLNQALRAKLPFIGSWQASVAILGQTGTWQFGAALSTAEQEWLAQALRTMCVSRS